MGSSCTKSCRTVCLAVTAFEGSFADDQPVDLTAAIADFIIRSQALGEVRPVPLPFDPGENLDAAAMFYFSLYGRQSQFATNHRWSAPQPDVPLEPSRTPAQRSSTAACASPRRRAEPALEDTSRRAAR